MSLTWILSPQLRAGSLQNSANGSTPLYRTTDGGTTWTLVSGSVPPTVPPAQLPDLTITQMKIELQNTSCLMPGDPTGVRIWVTNNGQAAAGSFVVRVNDVDQTVNALGVGETIDVFFPGYSNPVNALLTPQALWQKAMRTIMRAQRCSRYPLRRCRAIRLLLPTRSSAAEFAQTIVNALNARNFQRSESIDGPVIYVCLLAIAGNFLPADQAVKA